MRWVLTTLVVLVILLPGCATSSRWRSEHPPRLTAEEAQTVRALATAVGIAEIDSIEVVYAEPGPVFRVLVIESWQPEGRRLPRRELGIGWLKWSRRDEAPDVDDIQRGGFWIRGSASSRGGVFVVDGVAHEVELADDINFEEAELVLGSYLQSADYIAMRLGDDLLGLDAHAPTFVRQLRPGLYYIWLRPRRDWKGGLTHYEGVVLKQNADGFEVAGPFQTL